MKKQKKRGRIRVGPRGVHNLTGRVGSGRVGSGRVGSGWVGSGRVGSGGVRSGGFTKPTARVVSSRSDPIGEK